MGLLRKGDIISWENLWKTREIIKNRGIDQFIRIYTINKANKTNINAFGEELELITVIKIDDKYKLYCGSENIIGKTDSTSVEYARYMIEISSLQPYTQLKDIENGIIKKIKDISNLNIENIEILMMPCYPNMNFENFYDTKPLTDNLTFSLNFPDNGITLHKRFQSLTQNIRNRRGRKPEGYIKIMEKSEYILIDSVGQGMGCCCLQVTIQGKTIDEARYIYDMMGVLGPLLLRMTRGTPCANGKLLQTETRWEMLEISVDCRRNDERKFDCIYSNSYTKYPYSSPIPKSRFSSFDFFISNDNKNISQYNDTNPPVHDDIYKKLIKNGIDNKLATYVASLFIRDPFLLYKQMNEKTFDDFENIQSSNWRSVRFKIPTENLDQNLEGWKVEVRPMEIQTTPFENTAYIYFTYLIVKAILEYNLNFYIPISKVDSNFIKANLFIKNSADFKNPKISEDTQTFFYRCNIKDAGEPIIKEGTLKDIFVGTDKTKGILHYVYKIINEKYKDDKDHIYKYIKFIEDRLNNKFLCLSDWIRKFIITHKDYNEDSEFDDTILNELIEKLIQIRKENSVEYLRN